MTTTTVTQEQLDRCHRIVDENTGEAFYKVQSESDETVEYTVRYTADHKFTCTCPAGLEGFKNCRKARYCKHVTWSLKAAADYKEEQAEQSQIEAYVRQGIDRETATRVVYAQGTEHTALEVKRAEKANQRQAFSILR